MPEQPAPARKPGRIWNLIALLCILGGFAVEIAAVVVNDWSVFRAGFFLFLMSAPFALAGWFFNRGDGSPPGE